MNYKPSLWLLALTTALISCQKEPDWAEQSNEYLVYTQKDASFEAGRYENYFIADSILLIDDAEEPQYLKGTEAEKIISRVALNMERAGYHRTDRKEEADLGLQLSYIFDTHYFTSYPYPSYWWWGYPGYWDPYYWGSYWVGWDYSFPISYSYSENSLLGEMVDLTARQEKGSKLNVVWNMYINGEVSGYRHFDSNRMQRGIDQAFYQSRYLNRNTNP